MRRERKTVVAMKSPKKESLLGTPASLLMLAGLVGAALGSPLPAWAQAASGENVQLEAYALLSTAGETTGEAVSLIGAGESEPIGTMGSDNLTLKLGAGSTVLPEPPTTLGGGAALMLLALLHGARRRFERGERWFGGSARSR